MSEHNALEILAGKLGDDQTGVPVVGIDIILSKQPSTPAPPPDGQCPGQPGCHQSEPVRAPDRRAGRSTDP
ncbi:hypothetical protein [Pseudomonas fulva]|uniref:hypothetical protein n=1 Tax=Pseudomonas fulva TaxID=47880 RepID=UPI003CEED746